MNDIEVIDGEKPAFQVAYRLVDMASAEASAENDEHRRIFRNAQHKTALCTRRRSDGCAHRVAGDHELRCVGDVFSRHFVGKGHRSRPFGEKLVRHAHDGILLMHDNRHA